MTYNILFVFCDIAMMLLRSQSISHFNVKRTIWLPERQPNQSSGPEIQRPQVRILREVNFSQCLFLAAVVLTALW